MDIIDKIIEREGGDKYTNNPADAGGPTKYGITLRTLQRWRARPCTAEDVKNLTRSEARDIYHAYYVVEPRFTSIYDVPLRETVIDIGVNCGTDAATKMLQRSLGVEPDGVLGTQTVSALFACDPYKVRRDLSKRLMMYYIDICKRKPSQLVFLSGWINRAWEHVP